MTKNTLSYRPKPILNSQMSPMNYSQIIEALNSATGFDLFRIQSAINKMLDDPKRVDELRGQLTIGQEIEYFDPEQNRAIKAVVKKFKRTRISVVNVEDGRSWDLPYYYINIHGIDTAISSQNKQVGLDRNEVSVGEKVGFLDRDNNEIYGNIIRLNQKTVTINCPNAQWRVAYGQLFKVIAPDFDALPG
jgi:hypothetical protein